MKDYVPAGKKRPTKKEMAELGLYLAAQRERLEVSEADVYGKKTYEPDPKPVKKPKKGKK